MGTSGRPRPRDLESSAYPEGPHVSPPAAAPEASVLEERRRQVRGGRGRRRGQRRQLGFARREADVRGSIASRLACDSYDIRVPKAFLCFASGRDMRFANWACVWCFFLCPRRCCCVLSVLLEYVDVLWLSLALLFWRFHTS